MIVHRTAGICSRYVHACSATHCLVDSDSEDSSLLFNYYVKPPGGVEYALLPAPAPQTSVIMRTLPVGISTVRAMAIDSRHVYRRCEFTHNAYTNVFTRSTAEGPRNPIAVAIACLRTPWRLRSQWPSSKFRRPYCNRCSRTQWPRTLTPSTRTRDT